MDSSYDVIVVGAGPAGLASAKSAVEHGAKVLVIEDHAAIGTPVQCGESLALSSIEELGLEPNPSFVANDDVRIIRLYSPGKKKIELLMPENVKTPGVILERKMFEKLLAVKIANMGAHICTKTPAIGVLKENGFVVGVKVKHIDEIKDVRAKVVIAADGPSSKIAKWAGMDIYSDVKKFASCAQFQMANVKIDPKVSEIYLGKVAPGGGFWILPKQKGFANVGLGIAGDDPKTALAYLREFVEKDERLRNGSIIEFNVGPVPMGGVVKRMVDNGIMVVGDAARQVNPATGGGMKFGIRAGIIAGEVAANAVKTGDTSARFLSAYEKQWNKEFARRFKAFEIFKEMVLEMPDEKLDKLCEDIGTREVPGDIDSGTDLGSMGLRIIWPVLRNYPKIVLKLGKFLPSLR
ncbi:MAG: NAD(P)/FAD-dependent oxidoreductase [Methanomassiliicoccales archaeon]|nr:MAG: NAD(P)/FAD-dependent oxidoreductase [Methanomassiliicoccales archaeon]